MREGWTSEWAPLDIDAVAVWAQSGAQWLTSPDAAVPVRLVRSVAGLVHSLDERGAGLAALLGSSGVGALGERAAALGLGPSGSVSCGGATRFIETDDGWMAVSLARPEDVESIHAWLGTAAGGDPWETVRNLARTQSTGDVVGGAATLGIPCSALNEVIDRRPVLVEELGEAPPRELGDLVVANLSSLWAGPLAGDVLARLRMRVINVESTGRPDGARATPAFFEALHGRCESVALPLHTQRGRAELAALLSAVDIVIEGSRPRALEQMGIDAYELVRSGPRIWISITSHGRAAVNANRVGFGDDTAVAGGLVGRSDGSPVFLSDAVADPITGLTAAAAVVELAERGARGLVDVALARVAASMANMAGDDVVAPRHPAVAPRVRSCSGRPLPLGRDTDAVLREFEVR